MSGLRVLLTNPTLTTRTGAELYVHDVALGLLALGHSPVVYAPVLGSLADRLRDATIPVVDNPQGLATPPDVIHCQGNLDGLIALLQFPGVPAVRVCHGWVDEAPARFPRILRYVAVDETTRDRLLGEWGVPARQVQVLLNFVDLTRFRPRGPLPARPARALVFSNYARAHVAEVQRACAAQGIELEAVGASVGAESEAPETLLGRYDLVFAKGRCAIEALATGAAVVLCDASGVGPLVTSHNVEDLQRINFGLRALRQPLGVEALRAEIARYDAADAAEVSRRVRDTACASAAVDRLVDVYERVVAEQREHPVERTDAELRFMSAWLRELGPRLSWAQSPRAIAYAWARRLYFTTQRLPVLRSLLPGRVAAQRLQTRFRRP
jgi:hypothetical protein